MSENLPNIDDLFRKALEEHEDTPSGSVWATLDKNLDKKKVAFISRKYKKLKWVAAALLIFSAGMAMYTWNTRLRNKELVKQNEINRKKIGKTGGLPAGKNDASVTSTTTPGKKAVTAGEKPVLRTTGDNEVNGVAQADKTAIPENRKQQETNVAEVQKAALVKTRNEPDNKQLNTALAAEMKDKEIAADQKRIEMPDVAASENLKRDVEIATVREREGNVAMPEPPQIESGKIPAILAESNKEMTAEKSLSAYKKASVKPFQGSKFSATVFYSPDFVSSRVDNDKHAFREDDRNEIKSKERISNSSSKGVLVNYKIGNNWSIQSGLVFSTMITDIMPKQIFARPDNRGNISYRFNSLAGYSYVTVKSGASPAAGDSIMALSSKNTLQYFAIPFGLTYNIPVGRFSLQPGAGLAANFLTKGKIETEIKALAGNEKSSIDRIEGLNSSYLNGSLSLSANYYFIKNVALNLTPVARFALGGINKDAPVKTYLNSFGLAAGLTIGF